jgi:[glutamine synthetase] adenylyltransferase / [glutamine synthetase]-adenylyl-L-tyrosine phosphorylase
LASLSEKIEALARELPDPEGARLFYERVTAGHPASQRAFARDQGLLADSLALAAWSPLLASTLEQNADYLAWLARERAGVRVRTTEELRESLARFALTHSQLEPRDVLARFRRRELLRLYLHDIRRATTLVETTEELSNLADAVLGHALNIARQELENLYGSPLCTDERGRKTAASIAVVALGKLGSRELNYSSDVDLLFLYSDEGETNGAGERGAVTNREFFCKLAERVARIVGGSGAGDVAYRVDLRLRPHGRDGALAVSLAEALRYYRHTAHQWELQALIRARAAAGSASLFARFAEGVRGRVYRPEETVARALAHVRLAKQKIDRFHSEESRGFNVKLGRGGIREIEFIAQALQLAHGGRDAWLQAPHTLISLGRLADRHLINERERTELSDAYTFLRTVEHRLQMEHGLQTHSVPDDEGRRALLARRMHFKGARGLAEFDAALRLHTSNVARAYRRVFGDADEGDAGEKATNKTPRASASTRAAEESRAEAEPRVNESSAAESQLNESSAAESRLTQSPVVEERRVEAEAASALAAAAVFARHLTRGDARGVELSEAGSERARNEAGGEVTSGEVSGEAGSDEAGGEGIEVEGAGVGVERLARVLREEAARSLNPRRALALVGRAASSLEKSGGRAELSVAHLRELVRLCGASEFFGEMLTSKPALIPSVATPADVVMARDHRALLRAAVDAAEGFGAELSALRRTWTCLLVEVGARDVAGQLATGEAEAMQTSLAAASINVALLVARRELARRFGRLAAGPRLAALGLGRLGSGGMDYGSDLDLTLVYDPAAASPVASLTHEQAYARLVELLVTALSSLTRDGHLYRVDLRLRPDGKNGPLASSSQAFVNYLRERADVWEWLAYVKLRAVAGDLEFGREVERRARNTVHEAARATDASRLRAETRRVRDRLERERAGHTTARATDIKYGPGGMLDVYFAARYLQLRDRVPDGEDSRSTRATLLRLRDAGSINREEFDALCRGYTLLRELDHGLRLIAGRSTRLPSAPDHPLLADLARRAGHASPAALTDELAARMSAVRDAYERITAGRPEAGRGEDAPR